MSSTPLDLPVLISQMHYVAKIVHADKASPEAQQQLFGPLLREQVRQDQGKVQQVDKKERTTPVDRDGGQHQQQAAPERERKEKESDEDTKSDSPNPSPWSGNIVNVKI
ncbi:hypothetical protein GM415_13005 [Pseudodesulfovibrio cashew]|uniref:Uncharacterized protein n=1 Tax=Pseudodesulfovibrio cashew TaxID=2678688 RepID=A0A6I6JDU7_9BACT|nr:hypothetical protein [Pseudodesulfovibrio cashew]QGY41005.1 hypothetical protein GM415_13005 [Pseudodesulfovibrio cashew]